MKILFIHTSDFMGGGGATVAMNYLRQGLIEAGIDTRVMVGRPPIMSAESIVIPRSRTLRILESGLNKLTSRLGLNDLNYLNSFGVRHTQAYRDADIVHFHGTHGFFNYLALPGLTRDKPAVFTLHDMWPFTGHCAYSFDCERWRIGCGHCPYPDTHPAIKRDGTRIEWKLKQWVYAHSRLAIVSLSRCLDEQVRASMLNRFPLYCIPNGINTDIYCPLDRQQCRSVLGIPKGKKVLMFVAVWLNDHRKGPDLLVKSLQSLPQSLKKDLVLLTLGGRGEGFADAIGIQTISLGSIRGDRRKAIAYSAADLFVFPSRAETFGLVLAESMACGTPIVAFRVGGVLDLVRPGITGHLAEPDDVEEFSRGIIRLIEDDEMRERMSASCRSVAVDEYGLALQVQRHIELYRALLQERSTAASAADRSVPVLGD